MRKGWETCVYPAWRRLRGDLINVYKHWSAGGKWTGSGAMAQNWNTGSSTQRRIRTSLQWASTEHWNMLPGRLWSLFLQRYAKYYTGAPTVSLIVLIVFPSNHLVALCCFMWSSSPVTDWENENAFFFFFKLCSLYLYRILMKFEKNLCFRCHGSM